MENRSTRRGIAERQTAVYRIALLAVLCLCLAILLAACGSAQDKAAARSDAENPDGLSVVATIFPEYDFAKAIGGDRAEVTMLIDPGSGVHNFDPAPSDIIAMENADVFLYIGGESDEWVDDILESMDSSKTKVIRLMDYVTGVEEELKEGMEPEEEEDEEGAEGEEETEYDEHIWVSPKNAIVLVDAIADAMCAQDSANEEFYRDNAKAYKAELERVDTELEGIIDGGARRKIIVADRFPFRYFVDQYGLDYAAAFVGCSDQTDAGPKTIAHLVNTVKDEGIPYVFHVELSNKNVADVICEQSGAEMLQLNSGENVTKEDFDNGVTYVELMARNAESLRKGLY
ncbi:MAG: metal ABC transporter substrate-binding protein [Clostridiales Family XIII bacterium]|nr:metal ABC transporter substrate-binding protein [Clostridiales Family XIII bacterium]